MRIGKSASRLIGIAIVCACRYVDGIKFFGTPLEPTILEKASLLARSISGTLHERERGETDPAGRVADLKIERPARAYTDAKDGIDIFLFRLSSWLFYCCLELLFASESEYKNSKKR